MSFPEITPSPSPSSPPPSLPELPSPRPSPSANPTESKGMQDLIYEELYRLLDAAADTRRRVRTKMQTTQKNEWEPYKWEARDLFIKQCSDEIKGPVSRWCWELGHAIDQYVRALDFTLAAPTTRGLFRLQQALANLKQFQTLLNTPALGILPEPIAPITLMLAQAQRVLDDTEPLLGSLESLWVPRDNDYI